MREDEPWSFPKEGKWWQAFSSTPEVENWKDSCVLKLPQYSRVPLHLALFCCLQVPLESQWNYLKHRQGNGRKMKITQLGYCLLADS
jgi:hypothetical protein